MLSTFYATLSPMLVLFTCILFGYAMSKFKLLPKDTATALSRLEYYILGPALSLSSLSKNCTPESISKEYVLILYGLAAGILAIFISYLVAGFFAKDGYQNRVYKYAIAFGNFAYMGQPLVLAIFGDEMLYKYIVFTMPLTILVTTWGVSILIPTKRVKGKLLFLKNAVKFPTVMALTGVLIGITGLINVLPQFISQTLSSLGGCMGPIAMLLLGVVVGQYNLKEILTNKKAYYASIMRLIIAPTIIVAVFAVLGCSKTALLLILFAFSAPHGLNTVVYPASSGHDASLGASMSIISHTFSIITMPIMYALFTMLLG
ncbi:MAG: AEC family transporter [Ruminococcaceae bacterium]|nr:AEC family transporter [Oscillospiraceae bacterium]